MLKVLRRLLALVFGAGALYLVPAIVLGLVPTNTAFTPTEGGIPIAVCSNGVHTDFVLPVQTEGVDWRTVFLPSHYPIDVTGFDHIGIGWGDLDFYRTTPHWRDFDLGTALQALSGLGPAALHVQYRPGPGVNERCGQVAVSAAQYRALSNYIVDTVVSVQQPAAPGYGATDLFYPARGHFSLIKSCNVWVGQALKASGLPTGLWTPFSFQVLGHL